VAREHRRRTARGATVQLVRIRASEILQLTSTTCTTHTDMRSHLHQPGVTHWTHCPLQLATPRCFRRSACCKSMYAPWICLHAPAVQRGVWKQGRERTNLEFHGLPTIFQNPWQHREDTTVSQYPKGHLYTGSVSVATRYPGCRRILPAVLSACGVLEDSRMPHSPPNLAADVVFWRIRGCLTHLPIWRQRSPVALILLSTSSSS